MINKIKLSIISYFVIYTIGTSWAHDPVFSPGPHLLFKKGMEIHAEFKTGKQGDEKENEQAIAIKYGITGDWVAGIEMPYIKTENDGFIKSGIADVILSTKYRFWRNDSLGTQETAAIIAKIKLDSSPNDLSTNTTDFLMGLTYGYESLKWYRWASVRYRINQNLNTLNRGNRLFVDIAGGFRPKVNDYRKPDTVFLLELNGELMSQNQFSDVNIINSGGNQWFVSPGVMWTLRNFAIKAGVQIPLLENLNGNQAASDYRALLEFEWHL